MVTRRSGRMPLLRRCGILPHHERHCRVAVHATPSCPNDSRAVPCSSCGLPARLANRRNGHDDWALNAYWYYTLDVLLVLLNIGALATHLLTLPGRCVIVALTVLFAVFIHLP